MEDIRLNIFDNSSVNNEYVDNLLLLIELSDIVKDDNIYQTIEERLNVFTNKYIKLSEIKHKNSLYYEFNEYINKYFYKNGCYMIKCDIKEKDD